MNTSILLFLLQDGITNGAIYALLGLALVLVFAVTRVILIPQGEFITYGALTYATLSAGQVPGTARLALAMGVVAFGFDIFAGRRSLHLRLVGRAFAVNIVLPLVILVLTSWLAGQKTPIAVNTMACSQTPKSPFSVMYAAIPRQMKTTRDFRLPAPRRTRVLLPQPLPSVMPMPKRKPPNRYESHVTLGLT